jgi:hypothetical protein
MVRLQSWLDLLFVLSWNDIILFDSYNIPFSFVYSFFEVQWIKLTHFAQNLNELQGQFGNN